MEINYGTAPKGGSQSHTGAEVRVAAQGPQAANVVGLHDQTDLYHHDRARDRRRVARQVEYERTRALRTPGSGESRSPGGFQSESIAPTPRLSRPRATTRRWISEVPSQMRSTRSSRHSRSAAFVRM